MPDPDLPSVPPYAPVGTSIVYEDARTRIWETLLEPGVEQPLHQHVHPYVVVCIEPGENQITSLEGDVRETHEHPGNVVARGPGIHKLRNVGPTRYRNRLIELKTETS